MLLDHDVVDGPAGASTGRAGSPPGSPPTEPERPRPAGGAGEVDGPTDGERTTDDVVGELHDVAGHLNAQHGRLVSIAGWLLDHPDEWRGDGLWTPEAYLRWRCGVGTPTARKVCDVARRRHDLPCLIATMRRGEVSLDQVAPLARHAPAWADEQLAGLAPRCTVTQLTRIAARYPFVPPYEPPDDDPTSDAAAPPVDGEATPSGARSERDADEAHDADDARDVTAGGETDDRLDATPGGDARFDESTEAHGDGPTGHGAVAGADAGRASGASDAVSPTGGIGDRSSPASDALHGADAPPTAPPPPDRAWWAWGDDGRFRMGADVAADTGLLLEAALTDAHDTLFYGRSDDVVPDRGRRRRSDHVDTVDALTLIARRALDSTAPARRHRARVDVHVHAAPSRRRTSPAVDPADGARRDDRSWRPSPPSRPGPAGLDADAGGCAEPIGSAPPGRHHDRSHVGTLSGTSGHALPADRPRTSSRPSPDEETGSPDPHLTLELRGPLEDHRGRPIDPRSARHLTCDADLVPIRLGGSGLPVDVGRSQRTVPDRTRRLVEHRDGGCRVPGCANDRHLDVHHLVHWADGGPTDLANLVSLCPRHHRLHHHGRLRITGDPCEPDGLTFTDHRGVDLADSVARPRPPDGPPDPIDGTYANPIGERLLTWWLDISPPSAGSTPIR